MQDNDQPQEIDDLASFNMAKPSTTVTLRIDYKHYETLRDLAQSEGVTLNAYLNKVVISHLEGIAPPSRPAPTADKAFAQFLIPPATPLASPNPIWDAVGYMRINQDLVIDLHDDAAEQILGPLKGASLAEFKTGSTYEPAWEDMLACARVGQPFDAQLLLCNPSDPTTPVFVGLAFLFEAPYYYVRLNKAWENGQWVRKRMIRLDLPKGIKG